MFRGEGERNFPAAHVLTLPEMRSEPKSWRECRIPRRGPILAVILATIGLMVPATAATAKVPQEFFGIDAELPDSADYPDMEQTGFGSFRVAVSWTASQPTADGPYNWNQADARIFDAASNGMTPVVGVSGMPSFIHAPSDKGLYPPTSNSELGEWRDFNAALAARYGPGGTFYDEHPELADRAVRTWIMWNEQNSKPNWLPKPNPRQYAKLLTSGQQGLTSVDPDAEVVLGGMYGYPRDPKAMAAAKFLKKLYQVKGIEDRFDAISSHPYGPGLKAVKTQIKDLRSVAKKAGDRRVGLYVGELGWASDGPKRSEEVVGKKGQAQRLEDGLNLLVHKRKAWQVRGVFIYTWKDFDSGTLACNWCAWAGLVKKGGKAKPALHAVEKVIRKQT